MNETLKDEIKKLREEAKKACAKLADLERTINNQAAALSQITILVQTLASDNKKEHALTRQALEECCDSQNYPESDNPSRAP